MKRITYAALTCLSLLMTTACSFAGNQHAGSSTDFDGSNGDLHSQSQLSNRWSAGAARHASSIAADLKSAGMCGEAATEAEGVYGGEMLTRFRNNTFRVCYTWGADIDPSSVPCASTFYISTGDSSSLYDPKRSLSYEDGMSVALFYGENYQVEISPLNTDAASAILVSCSPLLERLTNAIGGSVTNYGDYDSQNSSGGGSEIDSTTDENVEVPNIVGSIDGAIESQLSSNGYKFWFIPKSTGFNPKLSCMLSGQNYIVDQDPKAGTIVRNASGTQLVAFVNCG